MSNEEEKSKKLEEIWAGDYLGRRQDATYLSKYLANRHQAKPNERGFVLAVNADWGVGKTFMVRNWCQQALLEQHPAVCFDAWTNDFSREPLIGFIAALDEALKCHYAAVPIAQDMRRELLASVKQVLIPGAKVLGAAMSKKLLGLSIEQVSDYFTAEEDGAETKVDAEIISRDELKEVGKDLSKAMEDALKAHQSTAKAIRAFKEKFALLIEALHKEANVQLPVYVFVDELDRCRPDYAIALLEGIKHLFGIPGLYFVIATNIEQLAYSIKAVYGEGFDAVRYLKRFFDMEFTLPKPDTTDFAKALLSNIFYPDPTPQIWGFNLVGVHIPADNLLPYTFVRYASAFRLELRDMEQAAHILEACFLTMKGKQLHMHWLIFLVMLYQRSTTLYNNLRSSLRLSEDIVQAIDVNAVLKFQVPRHNANGGVFNTQVSINEIIEVYLKALRSGRPHPNEYNDDTFPNIMLSMIVRSLDGGELKAYLDLVPRAGGFA